MDSTTEASADRYPLAVIGAGPAGLAAAGSALDCGLDVVLLDEQPEPGGQIYRAIRRAPADAARVLGADYCRGEALLQTLARPGLRYISGATVWQLTPERELYYSAAGVSRMISAGQLIIATGASERPMPFPGWTLPGVMTAGAAQILLKSSGLIPDGGHHSGNDGGVILAGSGPLLYLLSAQYLRAGVRIAALLDTTPAANRWRALRHAVGAARGNAYLRKGLRLLAEIKAAGVTQYRRVTRLRAEGDGRLQRLSFLSGSRRRAHTLDCGLLLIHNGVVPNVQLTRSLSLEHDWDALGRCWRPRLGPCGETALDGIAVAGDGGGIIGAAASQAHGALAGLAAAYRSEALSETDFAARSRPQRRALSHETAVRPFLDALYAPAETLLTPPDETLVCRCEEVSAAQIRDYVRLGCLGPNQVQILRPGAAWDRARVVSAGSPCPRSSPKRTSAIAGRTSVITASARRSNR